MTVTGATGAAVPAGANGRGKGARALGARSGGTYEVIPLRDAAGTFFLDRQAAFPAATQDDWELARAVDPARSARETPGSSTSGVTPCAGREVG